MFVFMIDIEDNIIVKKVLSGDANSFGMLVEKYQKMVSNLAFRMTGNIEDAKDLTQGIFIKIYDNLRSFDSKYKFYSWLYRISLNEILNYKKSAKSFEELSARIPDDESSIDWLQEEEEKLRIRRAVAALKDEYRQLVELKYFEDLSYKEIADILGISEKKVKSRLFTARELLKSSLKQ